MKLFGLIFLFMGVGIPLLYMLSGGTDRGILWFFILLVPGVVFFSL